MVKVMHRAMNELILNSDQPLPSKQERNLFQTAYTKSMYNKKNDHSIAAGYCQEDSENRAAKIFAQQVLKEIHQLVDELIELTDRILKIESLSDEDLVFYSRLKGEFYRHLISVEPTESLKQKCLQTLEPVLETMKKLPPLDSTRLSFIITLAVFYADALNEKKKAMEFCQAEFDAAVPELDNVSEEDYKDAVLNLQIMRDNVILWSCELADNQE